MGVDESNRCWQGQGAIVQSDPCAFWSTLPPTLVSLQKSDPGAGRHGWVMLGGGVRCWGRGYIALPRSRSGLHVSLRIPP